MLDGNKERIRLLVCHPVAPAMVLNLDDDSPELAYFFVYKQCPEQGIVLPGFTFVSNEVLAALGKSRKWRWWRLGNRYAA